MICPGCAAEMTSLSLDGQVGTRVQIDQCERCRAFWFDGYESLQLAPGSTLKLFHLMSGQASTGRGFAGVSGCPRCRRPLARTHDRQRATPFEYWRCEQGHGRFIAYLDFLKEKDFIRPLTGEQLNELRQNVQTVNCSNCGAPIDLLHESTCTHCGSPLSILDLPHMQAVVDRLQAAGQPRPIDPMLPFRLEQAKRESEKRMGGAGAASSDGLVEAGLRAFAQLIKPD